MSEISLEQARAAKAKAKRQLAGNAAVVGIGLTRLNGEYAVKVNLAAAPADRPSLPDSIDGVPVRCEVVGPIKAL
ncbi:MAG: hypothetical protein ACREIP_11005 [Alphaproteobacteria bacterium]